MSKKKKIYPKYIDGTRIYSGLGHTLINDDNYDKMLKESKKKAKLLYGRRKHKS